MKIAAAFSPCLMPAGPVLAASLTTAAPPAQALADVIGAPMQRRAPAVDTMAEPMFWRSEAFAEDLLDNDQPAHRARRGLLGRMTDAVLRR